jgi:X-Pro dipeptidyl-peptidase (S15 family)
MRTSRLAAALGALTLAVGLQTASAAGPADPLTALKHGCVKKRSEDPRSAARVSYVICSGQVASFDGTPLDVTLTLPLHSTKRRLPLIVFLHGFLADKGEYMSTTRSGTGPDRGGAAYKTVRWNNVWFASRGYAVLNYSSRGQGDSGGQIGLASKQVEVRDTQFLTGLLVDDRDSARPLAVIRPRRVGVIGSSYGGGQAWLLMTTRGQGAPGYGTWLSPKRRLVRLAAVVPGYTWTDLLYSLVPSGHQLSSGVDPRHGNEPLGIGKQTLIDGFIATAGSKFSPEVMSWLLRLNAGEPYEGDPIVTQARRALEQDRSAFYQRGFFAALRAGRVRPVPVLAGQGWTDPIFPALEAVRMYRALRDADPGYPIGLYLGDFEHLTAQVKIPDLRYFHRLGNRLLDHYLRGRGRRPSFDVRGAVTNCDPHRFGPVLKARNWSALHPRHRVVELGGPRETSSPLSDPRGPSLDPVLVSIQSGRGCIRSDQPFPPGVATYTFGVGSGFTTAGLPRLRLRFATVAPDIELNSRLWDLAPDGTMTLVDRGAYRAVSPDPAGAVADYELFGDSWRFAAGHRVVLEVTQDDSTYLRRDNFPSAATISDARLILPVRG